MQTIDTALVILAGGLGSRFGGDKQIEPFGAQGHFLFEYACYDAMQAGFQKVFIVVRPGTEELVSQQLSKWIAPTRFEIVLQTQERTKPWGTAHALHFLFGKWEGPFLVLNADDYYGPTICSTAQLLLQKGESAAALAFALGPTLSPNGPVARGICKVTNDGRLTGVEEVLKIQKVVGQIKDENGRVFTPDALISMNAWLLPGSFLTHLSSTVAAFLECNYDNESIEIYLPKVINDFIEAGQIQFCVCAMPAEWFGLTYAEDLTTAQEKIALLEGSLYPTHFPEWS
jgi:hypothetical protein